MTSQKFVIMTVALLAGASLPAAQARGGGAGGASSGSNSASNGGNGPGSLGLSATPTRPNPNSIFQNPFQNPITQGIPPAATTNFFNQNSGRFNQNAGQTINTGSATPASGQSGSQTVGSTPATGSTSATVAVGHAPNGLPIGSTGSGPGSPEQPIDSK
jgi:hypothetical protein